MQGSVCLCKVFVFLVLQLEYFILNSNSLLKCPPCIVVFGQIFSLFGKNSFFFLIYIKIKLFSGSLVQIFIWHLPNGLYNGVREFPGFELQKMQIIWELAYLWQIILGLKVIVAELPCISNIFMDFPWIKHIFCVFYR